MEKHQEFAAQMQVSKMINTWHNSWKIHTITCNDSDNVSAIHEWEPAWYYHLSNCHCSAGKFGTGIIADNDHDGMNSK